MSNSYPIEVTPPDITRWRAANTGIDYVHTFDSGKPGPHVLVGALMHGNEICGAVAVDRLLAENTRPVRGKLTFAFHNVGAYSRFSESTKKDTRFVDEDMNRVWNDEILNSGRDTAEIGRARDLRPLLLTVDRLLDIHSMGTHCEPLLLVHGLAKERAFVREMAYPKNVVCGSGHVKGRRLIEYAPFNDAANEKVAVLIECGQHWSKSSAAVALDMALWFMAASGAIDESYAKARASGPKPARQRIMEVTGGVSAETAEFRFVEKFIGLERFAKKGAVVAMDGGKTVVTPHDDCVLIMPTQNPRKGERVLRFAREVAG